MKYPSLVLISFVFLSCLLACGPNYHYQKKYDFPNQHWIYSDSINFSFEIEDTLKLYNLYLDLVHTDEFGYENLYTQIYTQFPSGERIKELLSLELSDKTGLWLGNCSGSTCKLRIPIQEGAYFNALGEHLITIKQYTRTDSLNHIKSLAFRIQDTGQTRQ